MAYVKKRKEVMASLTDLVVSYYTKKRFCVNREIGLCNRGKLRADFLAMNIRREIVIVEVKSCPNDFYSDHKWQKYLPYCNKFYFMMNSETYNKVKTDIPKGIGVIGPNDYELWFAKPARKREMEESKVLELVTRMAFRQADFNRYK